MVGFETDVLSENSIDPSLPKSSSHTFSGGVKGPLTAEPHEVIGVPNTYSQGIWKTRVIRPFIGGPITPLIIGLGAHLVVMKDSNGKKNLSERRL